MGLHRGFLWRCGRRKLVLALGGQAACHGAMPFAEGVLVAGAGCVCTWKHGALLPRGPDAGRRKRRANIAIQGSSNRIDLRMDVRVGHVIQIRLGVAPALANLDRHIGNQDQSVVDRRPLQVANHGHRSLFHCGRIPSRKRSLGAGAGIMRAVMGPYARHFAISGRGRCGLS